MRFSPRILLGVLLGVVVIALIAFAEAFDWGDFGRESQAALARQAKVTADQARSAALAAVPGTVQGVRLDREEGTVVYEVRIQPQAGAAPMDVTVDATTGKVLKTEPAREREGDGDD